MAKDYSTHRDNLVCLTSSFTATRAAEQGSPQGGAHPALSPVESKQAADWGRSLDVSPMTLSPFLPSTNSYPIMLMVLVVVCYKWEGSQQVPTIYKPILDSFSHLIFPHH